MDEKEKYKLKLESRLKIFGVVIGIAGSVLTFVWYDWKLFIIIMLCAYSNNIMMKYNKK